MAIAGSGMPRGPDEEPSELHAHLRPKAVAAFGGMGLLTTMISAVIWAPWWASVLLIPAAVLCAVVGMVFPQESADRLEWWRDYRRARSSRAVEREEAE